MFSKNMVLIIGLIVLIALSVVLLSLNSSPKHVSSGLGRVILGTIAPFQEGIVFSSRFLKEIWRHYFNHISVAKENDRLKRDLNRALEENNRLKELQLSNERLQNLLDFKKSISNIVVAAEVVGRDPSRWFHTVIINKGVDDEVQKGSPVVSPEGIVGTVIEVTQNYAKVLLIIDQNCAVDALVQNTRARGIIKGNPSGRCVFQYVLRKNDFNIGDNVVTTGLDGTYPKGLRIGRVSEIKKLSSGIFQEVTVIPYVDFEKLEEVLVLSNPPSHDFKIQP